MTNEEILKPHYSDNRLLPIFSKGIVLSAMDAARKDEAEKLLEWIKSVSRPIVMLDTNEFGYTNGVKVSAEQLYQLFKTQQ